MRYGCVYVVFFECLCCEFNPAGPKTGVDKLSSGCCLVSMGVLSYTALSFSLHFTRLPCKSLHDGLNMLPKNLRVICTRLANNRGHFCPLVQQWLTLACQLCAHICQKIYHILCEIIILRWIFFGDKYFGGGCINCCLVLVSQPLDSR